MDGLKERTIASDDANCFATLTKEDDGCFLYKLTWLPDGKFIGDYVKLFKATTDNVKQFNDGCKIMADWLQIYIETDDINLVPEDSLAFGALTFVK